MSSTSHTTFGDLDQSSGSRGHRKGEYILIKLLFIQVQTLYGGFAHGHNHTQDALEYALWHVFKSDN